MRCFLAGILLVLAPISTSYAQVRGEVESVGFQSYYRPGCWTPITVKITPETGQTDVYQLQVRQEDLDRDRPIFTRTITVTGNSEGQVRDQRFRAYFIPQPTEGGLPEPAEGIDALSDQLVVNICTESGRLIARLPVTSTITSIDPAPGTWGAVRGARFILGVSEGRSQPVYLDTATSTGLLGMVEDVRIVLVRPGDLPENLIGYDGIDGILWLDADPAALRAGGEEKSRALESYVRGGGRLVICQTPDWQRMAAFGQMLPVRIEGVEEQREIEPLRTLARPTKTAADLVQTLPDSWSRLNGPFRIAKAQPRDGAIVDEWVKWEDGSETPYIARQRVGLGSVTWVAQDLADPAITSTARTGWPYVWERVFDWKNDPVVLTPRLTERDVAAYAQGIGVDVGATMLQGMDLPSKTAWLITLAVVFFIAYWLIAGPGVFFYLVSRRRGERSWFAFALAALVATGLTVVLVRLVLRGPPELRHFTVVRAAPDVENAVVTSRMGMYIPRDGSQRVELRDAAPGTVSTISAFARHPHFGGLGRDTQGPEYTVPVVEATSDAPAAADIPYSSTLKKLQARWVGPVTGRVEGSASLQSQDWIEGAITNGTGQRLRNIYIAFKYPTGGGATEDWMLYLPSWEPGVTLDLEREFTRVEDGRTTPFVSPELSQVPEQGRKLRGRIAREWQDYWYPRLRGGIMSNGQFDDFGESVRRTLPMLSLFERLGPARNQPQKNDRFELHRRGARDLDVSHALAAGALVVLAEAEGPIPLPLYVEGDPVRGEGTVFYQFLLPLDSSTLIAELKQDEQRGATTQPATGAPPTPAADGPGAADERP